MRASVHNLLWVTYLRNCSPTPQSEINLSLTKVPWGEISASKICSIWERHDLWCKSSSGGKQYKPTEVTHMSAGRRAEPFLLLLQLPRLCRVSIHNCLQWLKAGATPLRSVSLLQKCILADEIRTWLHVSHSLLSCSVTGAGPHFLQL